MPLLHFLEVLDEHFSVLSDVIAVENVRGDLALTLIVFFVAQVNCDFSAELLFLLHGPHLLLQQVNVEILHFGGFLGCLFFIPLNHLVILIEIEVHAPL